MKSLSLLLILSLVAISASAQSLEVLTRFDYYLSGDSTATVLLIGDDALAVEHLIVDGRPGERLEAYDRVSRFRVGIAGYSDGDRSLPVRADLADGRQAELDLSLTVLPPRTGAVQVDRLTGGLRADGLPFFPFGFYAGYPVGDLPVQEVYNGMNLIGVYQSNEEETLAGRKAYMDLCASLGMKVNYAVNGLVGTPHNQTDAVISKEEEERRWALLRREVETFKDHPALLAWYMNDEPVGQSRSPELLEKAYRIIKEIDPYHPVSVVFVIPDRAAAYADAMDIAMTDPYPIPGDVAAVRAHMKALSDNFRFRKALWLVPQAFGGGEFWRREPTGPEIRAMTWLGIEDGAMGIQYFIRRHPNLFPKSRLAWNEAVRVAHEVSMIQPWLFSDEPRIEIETGSDRIRAVHLSHDTSSLILVTNADNHPAAFEIDLPSLESTDSTLLRIPFENRTLRIAGNRLSDTLGPLETRAYLRGSRVADTPDPHNLFPNPGFEWVASPGVPAGSYVDSDHRPAYDGSTYLTDSRRSHDGYNSLRLHAVADTSHLRLTFYRMYVEQGRTYRVSLWSHGATYGGQVPFVVSIPGLDLAKTFSTTDDWRQHTLFFRTSAETPFVQLALETGGAGTVWIDDVSVVPDPVVDVEVRDGPIATVRMQSQDPSTQLSYRLPGEAERPYEGPIRVDRYSELNLRVDRPDGPDETLNVTVPLSLATRKHVSFSTPYAGKYDGSGDGTIVDGTYGSLSFRDNRYLGFDGKDVEFTIDLERRTEVASVTVHLLVSPDDGIHAPSALTAWTSPEGTEWALLAETENPDGTRHGAAYHLSMDLEGAGRDARYIRVRVKSPRVIPEGYLFAGTDAWLFIDEVLVERRPRRRD